MPGNKPDINDTLCQIIAGEGDDRIGCFLPGAGASQIGYINRRILSALYILDIIRPPTDGGGKGETDILLRLADIQCEAAIPLNGYMKGTAYMLRF